MHTLTVKGTGSGDCVIELDGKPLKGLTAIQINGAKGNLFTAKLTMMAKLDIEVGLRRDLLEMVVPGGRVVWDDEEGADAPA